MAPKQHLFSEKQILYQFYPQRYLMVSIVSLRPPSLLNIEPYPLNAHIATTKFKDLLN